MFAWEAIIVVATTLAAVVIPTKLVLSPPSADFFVFEVVLTILFAADIPIHFKHAKRRQDSMKPQTYSPLWAIADTVAAIPFSLLPVAPAWQLMRLFKLGRWVQSVRRYWRRNVYQSLVLRIVMFSFWLSIATHWMACGWLALRGVNHDADAGTNYISSLYFCITTLTTVGYGDVTPGNNVERLFVIGMMLFGVGVYGFAIGSVASLLTRINPARAHYTEHMEKLDAFMRYKSLPTNLRRRLTEYYAYLWEQRLGYDESSILASLPPSLKTEVSLHLKKDIIQKVSLFKDASEGFIKEIALQITPVVYLPGDFVVTAGEPGNVMYFVSRGELEVVSKDGQNVFSTLKDGDCFGEIALVLKQPRSASVRASTYCDLYRLDRELFDRVLLHYPDVAMKIEELAKERQGRG
jgi:voltage-gated potassium channel